MNGQLSLADAIQMSFLSASKSKHQIIKSGIEILNGQTVDETGKTPVVVEISQEKLQVMLQCVLFILEHQTLPPEVQAFAENDYESVVFLTLFQIYQEALRIRIEKKDFTKDLASFRFSTQLQQLLLTTFYDNVATLTSLSREQTITHPSLQQFDWRVDVIISTTSLMKAFTSVLLLQFTTSTGEIKTVEASVEKFHQLRYSVAKMLANMQTINEHPTLMRLID